MRFLPQLFCVILLPAVTAVQAANSTFTARVGLSGIYSDNIELDETNEQEEFITQLTPGFNANLKGGRVNAVVDYQMQGLLYTRDDGRTEVFHQLDGTSTTELARDSLFLDVNANVYQTVIDPQATASLDNINNTNNRTDVITASISPYWRYRFANAVEGLARYRYGRVNYSDKDETSNSNLADSDVQEVSLSLGNMQARDKVWTWRLGFDASRVDFDDGQRNELRTVVGSLGFRVTSKLQLVADAGNDDNDFETEDTVDTSGFYWNTGIKWDPNTRNHLELGFGNRYGGDIYNFLWTRRARHFTLDTSYEQSLVTDANVVSNRQVPIDSTDVDRFRSDDSTYERKVFNMTSTIAWSKSTVVLAFVNERRETQDQASNEDELIRLKGSWRWAFSSLSTMTLALLGDRQKFGDTGQEDDIALASLALTRQLGPKTNGILQFSHSRQDSDGNTEEYRENRIWLSLFREF